MKDAQLNIRISEQEKTAWQKAANKRGMDLAEFIRYCVRIKVELGE
jgi:predicted DNA binding CopG/RHH family protein